jgi:hypothetical protein
MPARFLLLPALLFAAGCDRAEDAGPSLSPTAAPTVVAASARASAAASAAGVKIEESTDLYEFDYSYPAAAAAIPALKRRLDADMAAKKAELIEQAREGRDGAVDTGFDFHPYGSGTQWQVVTDLPGWLSLSASVYAFTGGAHPNSWPDALLWDRAAGQAQEAADLFTSPQALSRAIRAPFCDALDEERSERRGEKVVRSAAMFSECIDPLDQTIILGSSNRRTFDRIGVLVAPYNAGPYAEGSYEVTLPVTQAVLAAVRPEYRGAFGSAR